MPFDVHARELGSVRVLLIELPYPSVSLHLTVVATVAGGLFVSFVGGVDAL